MRLALVELLPKVLAALESFPASVRTLHALRLASIVFLRELAPKIEPASYDERLNAAARALGIPVAAV